MRRASPGLLIHSPPGVAWRLKKPLLPAAASDAGCGCWLAAAGPRLAKAGKTSTHSLMHPATRE
jgi:hypothetical protein